MAKEEEILPYYHMNGKKKGFTVDRRGIIRVFVPPPEILQDIDNPSVLIGRTWKAGERLIRFEKVAGTHRSPSPTNFSGSDATTEPMERVEDLKLMSKKLLKEFTCLSCHRVMDVPVTTPCAHNFCISCLPYQSSNCKARVKRARKNAMKCPSCTTDISDFLQKPQENTKLRMLIDSFQRQPKNVVSEGLAFAESSTGARVKKEED